MELDTAGTNHMTFTRAVRVDGRDVTPELWSLLDAIDLDGLHTDDERHIVRLFRLLRRIPSEYMQYFFFHDEVLAHQRASGRTRADEVMAILPDVLESYRREAGADYPRPSMARASEEHGDFAVRIAAAMLSGADLRVILNLPNEGQVEDLPASVIVETPAAVHGRAVTPTLQGLPAAGGQWARAAGRGARRPHGGGGPHGRPGARARGAGDPPAGPQPRSGRAMLDAYLSRACRVPPKVRR